MSSFNTPALWAGLALWLAAAPLHAATATATAAATQQPPRSSAQVKTMLKQVLQRLGDLSGYIDSVEDDGTVVITNVTDGLSNMACRPKVPKATFGKAQNKESLDLTERALEAVNRSLTNGTPILVKINKPPVNPGCLTKGGARKGG